MCVDVCLCVCLYGWVCVAIVCNKNRINPVKTQYPANQAIPYIHFQIRMGFDPSNGEATFVQSTRTQRFLKNFLTLSCWYSLDSCHRVLSDEYLFARVSSHFSRFLHHSYWPNQPPAAQRLR